MLSLFCLFFSFLLALRSVVLAALVSHPKRKRWVHSLFFSPLYLMMGGALLLVGRGYSWGSLPDKGTIFLVCFFFVCAFTLWNLKKKQFPSSSWIKKGAFAVFLLLWVGALLVNAYGLQKETPLLTITLTGEEKKEWLEWKLPQGKNQRELLPLYEVIVELPRGEKETFFLYGDLLGIKAKVLYFPPLCQFLGIHPLCQIESIHNGYRTSQRALLFPPYEAPLKIFSSHLWKLWKLWDPIFFEGKKIWGIQGASLESHYLPLTSEKGKALQKSYSLVIGKERLLFITRCADQPIHQSRISKS